MTVQVPHILTDLSWIFAGALQTPPAKEGINNISGEVTSYVSSIFSLV